MNDKIPYATQDIRDEDVDAVAETVKTGWLTQGPKIKEFEEEIARKVNAKYAVACTSGTAALHLACLALGLKENEELITSPMTFAASANCALYCQAKPIFVDIDEQGLIDIDKIEEKITDKTKIIIPVHYSGLECDMEKIHEIAKKYNLKIIEDACHTLGGKYKDSKIGDCKYSDLCVFSFHPVKHITTGEGGLITTNNEELYNKLMSLRMHGVVKNEETMKKGSWYYEMVDLGYNYRITDIQCSLGLSQLKKLDEFIEKRRTIAKKYDFEFENLPIEILRENPDQFNAYHLYIIKLKDSETRERLFEYLKQNNIFCQVHYIPVYWHPYYKKLGFERGLCPNCESFYDRILSIPMFPKLTNEEQEKVISMIKGFFKDEGNNNTSQNGFSETA